MIIMRPGSMDTGMPGLRGPGRSLSGWREQPLPCERGQSWIVASRARRRDWLTFSHLGPFAFPRVRIRVSGRQCFRRCPQREPG